MIQDLTVNLDEILALRMENTVTKTNFSELRKQKIPIT